MDHRSSTDTPDEICIIQLVDDWPSMAISKIKRKAGRSMGFRVLITEDEVARRINEAMAMDGMMDGSKLVRAETASQLKKLGEWFVIDETDGEVEEKDVDLEEFAREWQVLNSWEDIDW